MSVASLAIGGKNGSGQKRSSSNKSTVTTRAAVHGNKNVVGGDYLNWFIGFELANRTSDQTSAAWRPRPVQLAAFIVLSAVLIHSETINTAAKVCASGFLSRITRSVSSPPLDDFHTKSNLLAADAVYIFRDPTHSFFVYFILL